METLWQHMINPFAIDGFQLVQVDTRRLAPPEVCKATLATVALGTEQLNQFVQDPLMMNEKELSKPIRRNKLATFRTFEKAVYRGCGNYQSALKLRDTFSSLLERKKKNQLTRLCVTN